uniref:Protein kinase domain-containing protein n=1 Tax=Leptobrachium leishanense TaxID=445787 RepID=A0A8C5R6N7_9ANUR
MVFVVFLMAMSFLYNYYGTPRMEEMEKEEDEPSLQKGRKVKNIQKGSREKKAVKRRYEKVEPPLQRNLGSETSRKPAKQQRISSELTGEMSSPLSQQCSISLSDFTFLHFLGRGASGEVMTASWRNKDEIVVVKVIKKDAVSTNSILSECCTLKIARECLFLCEGLAAFQTQSHAFLVMPFLWGGSLASYLVKKSCLEIYEARFYSAEIICGLEFLHSHGILHLDIKPENLLFDGDGHMRIGDFGLVKENYTGDDQAFGVIGTTTHMAPEVAVNSKYGTSADWWSFGVTLFQMLVGCLPTNLEKMCSLYPSRAKKFRLPRELPEDSNNILSELLEKDPEHRLGVKGNTRLHSFYSTINWNDLERKNIQPPYQPQRESIVDSMWQIQEQSLSFMDSEMTESSSGDSQDIPGLSFLSSKWRD